MGSGLDAVGSPGRRAKACRATWCVSSEPKPGAPAENTIAFSFLNVQSASGLRDGREGQRG